MVSCSTSHATTGAANNFSGVTVLVGTNIAHNGAIFVNNFSKSGTVTSNAPRTWDGRYITSAGQLIVNSTLSTSFENNGTLHH